MANSMSYGTVRPERRRESTSGESCDVITEKYGESDSRAAILSGLWRFLESKWLLPELQLITRPKLRS